MGENKNRKNYFISLNIEKLNPKDVLKYLGWVTIKRQKKTAKKLKSESLVIFVDFIAWRDGNFVYCFPKMKINCGKINKDVY